MNPSAGPIRLPEREEKLLAIEIVLEDGLAMIAAIHDVIDRSRIFNAQLTGHASVITNAPLLCQC